MNWEKTEHDKMSAKPKRKRKSFLSKERAQGKRGRYGRGTVLDEETFSYFLRILEVKLGDFSSPEEREIFVDNVFEQTIDKELKISCNQLGSRAIEKMLPFANEKVLLRFSNVFSQDLRKIGFDEFGSHVLQELIVIFSSRLQNIEEETETSASDVPVKFKTWLKQVCKFVVNNLEEFVWNKYANHILRTVLECLSGLPPGSTSKEKKWEKKEVLEIKKSPIEEGHDIVRQCGQRILRESNIIDFVYTDLTSGFLQTLLRSAHKVDVKLTQKIVRYLLDLCFAPVSNGSPEDKYENKYLPAGEVSEIFMNAPAMHLMDVMISVASRKTFTKIYASCFVNKLKALCLASNANFCVQNLIKHCPQKLEFKPMFDELSSDFENLVQFQRFGVVLALGQTCQRLGCKQITFIKRLKSALHCTLPGQKDTFPLLIAHCVDYETWNKNAECGENSPKLPVRLQGSILVQTLLNFSNPVQIVNGLLKVDIEYLKFLFCTPQGSYVADAFFASTTVAQESKELLFEKLRGTFVSLAISKFGSRVLDTLWNWSPLNKKILILHELAVFEAMLKGVEYSRFFCDKVGLSLFKRHRKDWEERYTKVKRAENLFADIIAI